MGGGASKKKKDGEVVYPVFNKRYKVDQTQRLGTGSFGRVFAGVDLKTNEPVAIKVELKKGGRLKEEGKVYDALKGCNGIPDVLWVGNTKGFQALVLTLLGPSLDDLRLLCRSLTHDIDKVYRKGMRSGGSSPVTSPDGPSPMPSPGPGGDGMPPMIEPLSLGPAASSTSSLPRNDSGASVQLDGVRARTLSSERGRTSRGSSVSAVEMSPILSAIQPPGGHGDSGASSGGQRRTLKHSVTDQSIGSPKQKGAMTQSGSPKTQRRRSQDTIAARHSGTSLLNDPAHYSSAPTKMQIIKPVSSAVFSLSTVLVIGIQAIKILEGVHSRGWVHRDLKPANFVMRRDKTTNRANTLYLLDFGLAKQYVDPKSGRHLPEPKATRTKRATGTPMFVSRHAHMDVNQSRRDDMESLGYVLAFLLKDALPWKPGPLIGKDVHEAYIKHAKLHLSFDEIVRQLNLPVSLVKYFRHVMGLAHSEKPDYDMLQTVFTDNLQELQGTRDPNAVRCDWTLLGRKKRKQSIAHRRGQSGSLGTLQVVLDKNGGGGMSSTPPHSPLSNTSPPSPLSPLPVTPSTQPSPLVSAKDPSSPRVAPDKGETETLSNSGTRQSIPSPATVVSSASERDALSQSAPGVLTQPQQQQVEEKPK